MTMDMIKNNANDNNRLQDTHCPCQVWVYDGYYMACLDCGAPLDVIDNLLNGSEKNG